MDVCPASPRPLTVPDLAVQHHTIADNDVGSSCGGVLLPAPGVMSVAHVEDIYSAGFPPLGVVTKAHSEDIYSAGFPAIGVVEATACDTTATSSEGGLETSPARAPLTALARTFCPSALRLPLLCATLCNSTPHHARRR